MIRTLAAFAVCAILTAPAFAEPRPGFSTGPRIKDFGENAIVESDFKIPDWMVFKVAFDIGEPAEPGKVSRRLNTPARYLNMHARTGVREENVHAAIVVHGNAAFDLLIDEAYKKRYPDVASNANVPLVDALLKNNTTIYLCGQTAVAYGIEKKDLIPGVEMRLSAITTHAWLQQQGFSLNPF